jgi:hypothetical protein
LQANIYRKFNAERHNNKVHDGIAVISNKEIGRILDKRDIAASLPNIHTKLKIKK